MFNDPQLDVDKAPRGAQYKVGDLVFTCDNEIMVVADIEIEYNDDRDDPNNYDYLLMTKEGEEFWYENAQIEHKANHMKEVYHG